MYNINGYILDEPLRAKDAGFSRWGYGMKDGRKYFIKEFIDPVYPADQTLSDSIRKRKIMGCRAFSDKRIGFYQAINRAADGNLVRVEEFFRCGSHYYVAMPWIDSQKLTIERITGESLERRLLLCMTVAHGIMRLHAQGIVHADIKATNVLVSRTETGNLVGKIIDYDCGFPESDPPELGELSCDQVYVSPEAWLFICDEECELTTKMDVFSMGLLFHQYLSGQMPAYDTEEYHCVGDSVLAGVMPTPSPTLPAKLRQLMLRMLAEEPDDRCTAAEAYDILRQEYLALTPNDPVEPVKPSGHSWFTAAGNL